MAGDAWEELSGYDGRFARTLALLIRRPGALTVQIMEGRRARYVSPVRLYLAASVLYFLVAAAAPNLGPPPSATLPRSDITIDLTNPGGGVMALPPERREEALRQLERAPWWLAPVIRSALLDPGGFRRRFLEGLPRALFALVPAFAGILALFYRRRRFLVHLVFALHLHTTVFLALTLAQLANFTYSRTAALTLAGAVQIFVAIYALRALRRVYGQSWTATVIKSAGIALVYLVVGLATLTATFAWVAMG
jgi:hypothetical protein